MEDLKIQCPGCTYEIQLTVVWIKVNSRICCMNCNKAYEIPAELKSYAEKQFKPATEDYDYTF